MLHTKDYTFSKSDGSGCFRLNRSQISKTVTTPLWTLSENRDTTKEDMTQQYLHLSLYLVGACENVLDIMWRTFPSLTGLAFSRWQNFWILNKRVNIWYWCGNHFRSHVTTINSKSSAHVYKDHLPNERYESFIEELSQATCTKSVDKHNSYSERLFAYMDQILKSKPNI